MSLHSEYSEYLENRDRYIKLREMSGGGETNKAHREVELQFHRVDTQSMRRHLRRLGGKRVRSKTIMPLMVFAHPLKKKDSYIRIRDEGDKITLTSKTDLKEKYVTEYETTIDSFEQGVLILRSLGCEKRYYVEKIREIWKIDKCEVVFDAYPGLPEYMEIECADEKNLHSLMKKLKIEAEDRPRRSVRDLYLEHYGIPVDADTEGTLSFKDGYKVFRKHILKNRKKFRSILKEQNRYYSKGFDPSKLNI